MRGTQQRVKTQFFHSTEKQHPLELRTVDEQTGKRFALKRFTLAYQRYGRLNREKSNAVLLFHALTGSQHAAGVNRDVPGVGRLWTEDNYVGWWDAFIGPGRALDTDRLCVVCVNFLGGCYGSSGPTSDGLGELAGAGFPPIRVADIVDSQMRLLDYLGIKRLHAVVGPSIGGFMALSLATRYPQRVRKVVSIASGLRTTPFQRVLNFEQMTAIENDPQFKRGCYGSTPPLAGLELARRIAHKTFVSLEDLGQRARKTKPPQKPPHAWYQMNSPLESYLWYQGRRFAARFDANSYMRILDAWQWFDLEKEAERSLSQLLSRCRHQEYLVFSIDSDGCFPREEQGRLVAALKQAGITPQWMTVHSTKGHDSFLTEPELYAPYVRYAVANDVPSGAKGSARGGANSQVRNRKSNSRKS